MESMFAGCSGLTGLDLSSFYTDQLQFMDKMFYNCSGLKTIYATNNFVTVSVLSGEDVFTSDIKLV